MSIRNKNRNISIIFDDVLYFIEADEKEYKCLHGYEYNDCVHILLTQKQLEQYLGDHTKREFMTTKKMLDKFIDYITNSYWRRKR